MAGVHQQVNGLPLVGNGCVADHWVVADVSLGDSASYLLKAEIRFGLSQRKNVQSLVPAKDDTVQLSKVLCKSTKQ